MSVGLWASGRIINMSSVSGLAGQAGQANYSLSRPGLVGLARAVAREVAGWGTANAITPGFNITDYCIVGVMTHVVSAREVLCARWRGA